MRIGILHCGHPLPDIIRDHGEYIDMFRALFAGRGWSFEAWDVVDMLFPQDPTDADAWIVSGSKHGAYEDLPFVSPLEEFIRTVRDAGIPMVGICFGHQVIAQALGGKVEKFAGGWAVGQRVYQVDGLGEIALNAWHQDQITAIPEGAEIVASNDFCRYAGLAIGQNILTLQPHPEFTDPILTQMAQLRDGHPGYPAQLPALVDKARTRHTDAKAAADWIADFIETTLEKLPKHEMARHG